MQVEVDPQWRDNVARVFAQAVVSAIPHSTLTSQYVLPDVAVDGWDEHRFQVEQDELARSMEHTHEIGTLTRLTDVENQSATNRREVLRLMYQPTRIRRGQRQQAILNQSVWTRQLNVAVSSMLQLFAPASFLAHSAVNPDVKTDLQLWKMMQAKGLINARQQLTAREWSSLCSSAAGYISTTSLLEPDVSRQMGRLIIITDSGFMLFPN